MLIVDGHNLMGRTPGLSLAQEEQGRELLLRRVAGALGSGRQPVVVVFDGNRPGSAKESRFGGVRVVYSPGGRAADDEILRRLEGCPPGSATVVTSDRRLAGRARDRGARVEACEAFLARLDRGARVRSTPAPEPSVSPDEVEAWLEAFRGRHKI